MAREAAAAVEPVLSASSLGVDTAAMPVTGYEALSTYIQDLQRLQLKTIADHLPLVRATGIYSGADRPPTPPKSTIKPLNSRLQVTPGNSTYNRVNVFGGVVPEHFPTYVGKSGVPHPFLRGYKGDDRSFNKSAKVSYCFTIRPQTLGRWQQETLFGVMPSFSESWAIMTGLHSGPTRGFMSNREA